MDADGQISDGVTKEEGTTDKATMYTTFLDKDNLPQLKCLHCGVTYIKRCMMEKHVVVHFAKREKFKCDQCDQEFNRPCTVKEHKKRAHEKIERFFCFVCQKGFYERTCMLKHLNVHDEAIEKNPGKPIGFLPKKFMANLLEKGFVVIKGRKVTSATVCMKCHKILSSAQTLRRHSCPVIKAESSIKTETPLEGIIKTEKQTVISCILDCSKVFNDLAEFDLHMKVGDHDGGFFFSCPGCKKKFASTKAMKSHPCQQNVEMEEMMEGTNMDVGIAITTIQTLPPLNNMNENMSQPQKSMAADIVQQKQSSTSEEEGVMTFENVAAEEREEGAVEKKSKKNGQDGKMESKAAQAQVASTSSTGFDEMLQEQELSEQLDSLSCTQCGQNFSSAANLEFHLRVHRIEKIRPCRSSGCEATFANVDLLAEHKLVAHGIQSQGNGSRYIKEKCEQCDFKFNKYDMKKHMLRHTTEKNFTCAECGKKLKRQDTLNLHMMLHTGVKQFKCDQCGHNFYSMQSLQNHKNNRHSDSINMCAECGKECPNKYDLKWHMAKHTGEKSFPCREEGCEKRFRLSTMRSNHEKIHSGQKDYHCNKCEKSFIQRTALMVHLKRHYGIKNHICTTCGKAFVEPAGARNCKHAGSTGRSIGPKLEAGI